MAVINFDTTQAPSASLFSTITNVSSNGTHWVFAAGAACKLVTNLNWPVNASNTFTIELTLNMPSTALSYNGLYVQNGSTTAWFALHWEAQNHYDVMVGGTTVYTGSVTGGVDVKLKVVASNTDTKYYVNDVLVYTGAATFANSNVRFGVNKYTEGAGYVRSGFVDGAWPSTINRLQMMGVGS